jgi:ElaB/YqjD/DUF883 family membrane-anchored ribosome-binding protein
MEDIAAEIEGRLHSMTAGVRSYIERHPLAAVGIALGAGLFIAVLLRRND